MSKWLKDPLWVFIGVGAVLLLIADVWQGDDADRSITVSENDITRLKDQWAMQMRRAPTEEELNGLIEAHIREEVYYREAMRMGLDANDTIVRRRMVQKLTFLTEDIATAAPPEESELNDYYASHTDTYTRPARISFRHRYFSVDRREDALADAENALKDPAVEGDPFMLQRVYAERSEREIGDLFGRQFAEDLFALQGEGWLGPIRSAYGWHAVLIENRLPQAVIPFEEARERVRTDYQMQQRKDANARYYETLLEQYQIERP